MEINHLRNGTIASVILDWLRFLSALLVFMLHATHNPLIPGYQAVMVFFVLSGFFISSSVLKSMENGTWSWRIYLINRLTRLWVVLIPALIATAIWINLQIKFFGVNTLPTFAGSEGSLSISSFIQNLFFLQGVFTSKLFGYNGPLWSLSFEFWYYMLFPIMILTFKSKSTVSKVCYGITFIALSFILGKHIMSYYIIWLLGAVVVVIKPSEIVRKYHRTFLTVSLVLAAISLQALYYLLDTGRPLPDMTHYVPDLSVGLCFAFLVYVIVTLYSQKPSLAKWGNWGTYLAGMSYTLYLVHYPVLNFVNAWHMQPNSIMDTDGTFSKLGMKIIIFVFIMSYAWLFSRITEYHTATIKNWIMNIGRKSFDVKREVS